MGQWTSRATAPVPPVDHAEPAITLPAGAPFATPWLSPDARGLYDHLYLAVCLFLNTDDPDIVSKYVNKVTDNRFTQSTKVVDTDQEYRAYKKALMKHVHDDLLLAVHPGTVDAHLLRIARTLGPKIEQQVHALMSPSQEGGVAIRTPDVPWPYRPVPSDKGFDADSAYVLAMYLIENTQKDAGICNTLSSVIYNPLKNQYNYTANAQETQRKVRACMRSQSTLVVPLLIDYDNSTHYNILFVNFHTRTVEHFEPHGFQYEGESDVALLTTINDRIEAFGTWYARQIDPSLTYVPRSSVCPVVGPQDFETTFSNGYCVIWGLYLFNLRLLNPMVPLNVLVDAMLSRPGMLYELTRYRCQMVHILSTLPLGSYPEHVRVNVRYILEDEAEYLSACLRTTKM